MQMVCQTGSTSRLIGSDAVPDRVDNSHLDTAVCDALHLAMLTLHLTVAWHSGVVTAQSAMEALHDAIADIERTASRRPAVAYSPMEEKDASSELKLTGDLRHVGRSPSTRAPRPDLVRLSSQQRRAAEQ
jgi:hypothetical protein